MRKINFSTIYHSLLYLTCCLLPFLLTAQQNVLPFHQLTIAEGLTSQSYNYYVFKDSEGYVWVSSINGLNRYDGQSVRQYTVDENDNRFLRDGTILGEIYEDEHTNIWFGTQSAIHCYNRKNERFEYYKIYDKGEALRTYKLFFVDQKKQKIWVAVNGTLYWFSVNAPNEQHIFLKDYLFLDGAHVVESDQPKQYTMYAPLLGESGLGKVRLQMQDTLVVQSKDTLMSGIDVAGLYYEDAQHIWLTGQQGLHLINEQGQLINKANRYDGRTIKSMRSVVPFDKKELLVSTVGEDEGAYIFDKESFQFTGQVYDAQNYRVKPFNEPVDNVTIDTSGTIWFSVEGVGVLYTSPAHKKVDAYLQNLEGAFSSGSNIIDMAEDSKGQLWCLTREGVAVIDNKGLPVEGYSHLHRSPPECLKTDAYAIFADSEDRIWVCTLEGLCVKHKNDQTFKKVVTTEGANPGQTLYGLALRKGNILVATESSPDPLYTGLFEVKDSPRGPELRIVQTGQKIDFINYIFEDSDDQLYLCDYAKEIVIGRFEQAQFVRDTALTLNSMVTGMVEDKVNQCIWISTAVGLYQLKKQGQQYSLSKNSAFDIFDLKGLLYDETDGQLWISSTSGLYAFDPANDSYRHFTQYEGLQAPEYNFYSALKTSNGLFAFGGINGLNLFKPSEALRRSGHLPVPKITQILINNEQDSSLICQKTQAKNVSQFHKLDLKFKKNTVSFNFAALDYCDPTANQFKYKMEGVDQDWVLSGTKNFARYPNLPIGTYTFKVQASSAEGVWPQASDAAHTASLVIQILPPWWRTWWAYALWSLLGMSFIYAIYRVRINQIKKDAEFKRKEAEFKQKEAEYKQLAAETETAVLRLQMNPHFIFNSMNSISRYISDRDIDTANSYLSRFAKLMRLILKLGKQPLIPIADEIDILDQYLKTEAMRFERKFDYDFEVDSSIDEDDNVVPTMILQPFIENAIWHGLSGKEGKGHINIRFWKDNQALYVSVEDDGIGREAARKTERIGAHKSQALDITRRRLRLLGEKEGQSADFKFEDILNDKNQVAGTRVLLQLPLL